jgi:hypothetical protein
LLILQLRILLGNFLVLALDDFFLKHCVNFPKLVSPSILDCQIPCIVIPACP